MASHPSASYRLTLRGEIPNYPGQLGRLALAVGQAGGDIGSVDTVRIDQRVVGRDITISTSGEQHGEAIVETVRQLPGSRVIHVSDRAFPLHLGGKIEVTPKAPIRTRDDLSMAYTPGLARICRAIPPGFGGITLEDISAPSCIGIENRPRKSLDNVKERVAANTNTEDFAGSLSQALEGADSNIGVSAPGLATRCDVQRMAKEPMVLAVVDSDIEVISEDVADVAELVATGRSDYPNQIDNVLAFPGIFRGELDCQARGINAAMSVAAAHAIAETVSPSELSAGHIVPSVFDRRVAAQVAGAVTRAVEKSMVARRKRQ